MAQVRDTLSIVALHYLIANNGLLGTAEPRNASMVEFNERGVTLCNLAFLFCVY